MLFMDYGLRFGRVVEVIFLFKDAWFLEAAKLHALLLSEIR